VGWGAQAARGPGAPGMGVGPRGAQARGYFIRPPSLSLLYFVLYPYGGGVGKIVYVMGGILIDGT
jgi:hypothetical protein